MKPIILTPLQSGNPCLSEVVSLYEKAFPLEERRPTDEWLEKNSSSDLFTINLLESDGQTLGFITIWQFEDFAYVEHFAVDEKQRGNGIGAATISALRAALPCPVVLEVEPPTEHISIRRIRFYERNGFVISSLSYLQPPYTSQLQPLELKLMSTDATFLSENFDHIVSTLYKYVYNWQRGRFESVLRTGDQVNSQTIAALRLAD